MKWKPATLAAVFLCALSGALVSFDVTAQSTPPAGAGTDAPKEDAVNATTGKVTKVIAYRGQALVTREIEVPSGTGMMDVVVTKLPDDVFGDSLFADGGDGAEVRAVRYRTRVENQTAREDLKASYEKLEELDAELRKVASLRTVADRQSAYLDKLDQFVTFTATQELAHGKLNDATLKSITDDSFRRRETIATSRLALDEQGRKIEKDRQVLQMRIQELGGQNSRYLREAVIFLDKRNNAPTSVRLNYLVGSVNWRPAYSVRATTGGSDLGVEYSALITQTSGEDWKDVSLTLSTASPALIAQGAQLAALTVGLVPTGRTDVLKAGTSSGDGAHFFGSADDENGGYERKRKELRDKQLDAARSQFGGGGPSKPGAPSAATPSESDSTESYRDAMQAQTATLNSLAQEIQNLEFNASTDVIKRAIGRADGISVEYELPGRIGIATRRDQQLVRIAKHTVKSDFFHVASPVLSDFVYLHAEAKNSTSTVFLEGTYTAYLDGRFVGKSAMPMVAQGENFMLGFGIDSQLRVSRELVDKKVEYTGGNRETTFSYKIGVQNFKDREVNLRLFDRIPHPKETDIRVTLLENTPKLSEDKVYLRDQRTQGMLRWDLNVKSGQKGAEQFEVTYKYRVEHAKNMEMTGTGG